jgi:hypothetical protein
MKRFTPALVVVFAALLAPGTAFAQDPAPVPAGVRQAEQAVERAVERFSIGVQGGIGIDPELIDFGAHATFGPIFSPRAMFRPGIEFGLGEITTLLNINLDVLYFLPGSTADTRWAPYVGAGPAFGLSHRSFETDEGENVDIDGPGGNVVEDDRNRFDFSDTDFNGAFNFIVGARNQGGVFFEMKATAGGVSTIRLLGGFDF